MDERRPALQGLRLRRTFGKGATQTTALREVSLQLFPGEVALIMGPSGSGKSTLLAVLSGLMRPDGGQVLALGQDLGRLSDQARKRFRLEHCGFIFQGYNLFPALTAREQLEMVLRWGHAVGRQAARRRAQEMLELLNLARKGDLRPAELSGGEQQRVSIGRALIKEPRLCFADEPTAALDWSHGQQVIELLRIAARDRGATIVVVSHDPRLLAYADRIFRLVDGSISESPQNSTSSWRMVP